MSPQLVSNRKIRPEGERLACSEHQPFQKKKGEGARSGNLLFMFFIYVTAPSSIAILYGSVIGLNKKHKKKVAAPSTLTFLLLERLVL